MTTTLTPERIEELLSCPFCGSDAFIIGPVDGLYRAQCKSCGTSVGEFKTRKECAPFWNCRALSRDGMREALAPFAKAAEMFAWPVAEPDSCAIAPGTKLTVGDLRRARDLLSPGAPRQKVEG